MLQYLSIWDFLAQFDKKLCIYKLCEFVTFFFVVVISNYPFLSGFLSAGSGGFGGPVEVILEVVQYIKSPIPHVPPTDSAL